jgi:hypothetical protein
MIRLRPALNVDPEAFVPGRLRGERTDRPSQAEAVFDRPTLSSELP